MRILYKTVTADAQAVSGECYLVGVELTHAAADTSLIVYDENTSSKTAARKVVTLLTSVEAQCVNRMFPLPGIKCDGIYCDWTAGVATIYYYR